MKRIDAHNHFWKFDPVRDSWINNDMKAIQSDFLPADLQVELTANGFAGCVVVQSDQSEEENEFQLKNAEAFGFIKGIVGWVDLQADNIDERLKYYSQFKKMKGFRHVLQGEAQRDLMLKPAFIKGIGYLKHYEFSYDILIFPDQLQFIPTFVSQFPDQLFVIDHLAKPNIKGADLANWKKWKTEDFTPYIDVIVEVFGTSRIMFGSDWPVCKVAASYTEVVGIVKDYFSGFSKHEQEKVFALNAMRFYKL